MSKKDWQEITKLGFSVEKLGSTNRNNDKSKSETGFSNYLFKCLKRHLESNLIEVEVKPDSKNHAVENDGIFLFKTSSEKLHDVSDSDNIIKLQKKIHKNKKKKKKYESESDTEENKIQAIAVSGDWIMQNSAIYSTNDVHNMQKEKSSNCKKKKKKHKHLEKS